MSGLGKQLRGSGIAKIQNQRTPFKDGSDDPLDKNYQGGRLRPIPIEPGGMGGAEDTGPDTSDDVYKHMKRHKKASGGSTNWIQGAIKKPGSLRKSLGVKKGEKIPAKKLAAAAKKPGKLGRRARLAQTLKGLK
jgi:hypothetical protein